jgi:hypothetical protein
MVCPASVRVIARVPDWVSVVPKHTILDRHPNQICEKQSLSTRTGLKIGVFDQYICVLEIQDECATTAVFESCELDVKRASIDRHSTPAASGCVSAAMAYVEIDECRMAIADADPSTLIRAISAAKQGSCEIHVVSRRI